MNSDNLRSQRGNAMVYILVALALFGILTAVLARRGAQTDTENLTEEMAQFESAQILAYAQSTQKAVDQMLMSGTTPDDIDFTTPNDDSFDDGAHIYKLFHPEGGGLTYKSADTKLFDTLGGVASGWYIGMFNNVEWTPTLQQDIMLTAYGIKQPVCEAINEKITGSKDIPALSSAVMSELLVPPTTTGHSGSSENLMLANCPALPAQTCREHNMMCVSDGGLFGFYTVIEGR